MLNFLIFSHNNTNIDHFPSTHTDSINTNNNGGRTRFDSAPTDDNTYNTQHTNNTHTKPQTTIHNTQNTTNYSAVNNIQNYSEYYTQKLSESPNHKNAIKRMKNRVSSRAPGLLFYL